MDANLASQVLSGIGLAGGLWAIVTWLKQRNGHNAEVRNTEPRSSPAEPPPDKFQDFLKEMSYHNQAMMGEIKDLVGKQPAPIVLREPQPKPEWVEEMESRLAKSMGAFMGTTPSSGQLQRITDLMEALLQLGPPVVHIEPPDLTKIQERLDDISRKQSRNGSTKPPREPLTRPEPKAQTLVSSGSIPPNSFGGTLWLSEEAPQSLLHLVQNQLQPNCPATCVQFRLSAESKVYVGYPSSLGGPLSKENFAYILDDPDDMRTYQSAYPGNPTPIGDLQVLGSGALHVEVQL